jgi:hypothetical protein
MIQYLLLFILFCFIRGDENSCGVSEKTQKTALITGITGQDGSYPAEFLLEKGYKYVIFWFNLFISESYSFKSSWTS